MHSDSTKRFAVFGLGSTAYPKYCAFAKLLDQTFEEMGIKRCLALTCADELQSQEKTFDHWLNRVTSTLLEISSGGQIEINVIPKLNEEQKTVNKYPSRTRILTLTHEREDLIHGNLLDEICTSTSGTKVVITPI